MQKIGAGDGRLAELLKAKNDGRSDRRRAVPGDAVPAADGGRAEGGAEGAGRRATAEEVFRDLFWALLNSKEFAFNH